MQYILAKNVKVFLQIAHFYVLLRDFLEVLPIRSNVNSPSGASPNKNGTRTNSGNVSPEARNKIFIYTFFIKKT